MNIFTQTLGLVSESDYLSLSEGLNVQLDVLVDSANGARHQLEPRTAKALAFLNHRSNVGYWIKRCKGLGLRQIEAIEIIVFLNDIAGLRIIRKSRWYSYRRLRLRLKGIRPITVTHRYRSHWWGLSLAVSRAVRPVIYLIGGLLGLAYGGGLLTNNYVMAHLGFVVCLYVSTLMHEAVHIYGARTARCRAFVIVRGYRIGVLHRYLGIRSEVRSALLGPTAGVLSAVSITSLTAIYIRDPYVLLSVGVVALFHLLSWLPQYGDGHTIKKLRRFYATAA